jgi:hypothetical protein
MCGAGKGLDLCEEEDPSHGTARHGVAQHAAPLQERRERKEKERGHVVSCLYGLAVGLRDGVDLKLCRWAARLEFVARRGNFRVLGVCRRSRTR